MKRTILVLLYLILMVNLLSASGLKEQIKARIDQIETPKDIKVFLISMIPIFELRGSIPIGIHYYKLPYWRVIPISIVGNMIPIFLLLIFYDLLTRFFFKFSFTRKILEAIFARTRKKSEVIKKYEEIGLMLFVAIPLPITGAWTGSLAAYLFGLKFWKSIFFIFLGVLIAATVVSFLTSLKWIGAAIALIALTYILIKNGRKKKQEKIKH